MGISVLVVTDQQDVRDELRFGFPEDVVVSFAVDAREAWKLLPEIVPSVLVVDLQTGSAGGFGLARDVRAASRWRDIPVIMLLEREQDVWLARQAGAQIVRTKPALAGRVDADIRSLLGDSSALQ